MLNKATIIGRVGRDPEVRYMPSGDAVAVFSVATSERRKNKETGEVTEDTTWHRVSCWGKLGEIAGEYLKKGALVYIEGKMVHRKYTGQDGIERTSVEIRASEMKMLSGRDANGSSDGEASAPPDRQPSAPSQRASSAPPANTGSGFDDMDNDIPF
jgi:single-strand DNA-binding protein